jgi:hypothetical protein
MKGERRSLPVQYLIGILKNETAAVTAAAVIIALSGLIFGFIQYNHNIQIQKKTATIQYLAKFADVLAGTDPILLDTINLFGNKQNFSSLNKDTLARIIQSNNTYRQQIDNIMVYLNQLAIGCKEDFFDERTAWGANYYRIINATNALEPYFKLREKEENLKETSQVCWYLRNMVKRWKFGRGKYKKWNKEESDEITKRSKETNDWEWEKRNDL